MDCLSQEIPLLSIPYLFQESPIKNLAPWDSPPALNIALYATTSRSWQHTVERFTMADIRKFSSELNTCRQVFALHDAGRF
jgi:hypothetical protein